LVSLLFGVSLFPCKHVCVEEVLQTVSGCNWLAVTFLRAKAGTIYPLSKMKQLKEDKLYYKEKRKCHIYSMKTIISSFNNRSTHYI
jgi:hypothetical protein